MGLNGSNPLFKLDPSSSLLVAFTTAGGPAGYLSFGPRAVHFRLNLPHAWHQLLTHDSGFLGVSFTLYHGVKIGPPARLGIANQVRTTRHFDILLEVKSPNVRGISQGV